MHPERRSLRDSEDVLEQKMAGDRELIHILIVDDDMAICQTLKSHFQKSAFQVSLVNTAEEGINVALSSNIDAIISDIRLPAKGGLDLLREVKAEKPELPIIMITAFHDMEMTVAAMQCGAMDYVPKPIDLPELDAAVSRALFASSRSEHVTGDPLIIGATDVTPTQIVGQSFAMKEVFKTIALVAQSRVTALILGESGTGKELVARAIHNASAEKDMPFIAVNCAALVDSLLESELFGHERGAFTGAVNAHKGKVEQVGEGTLFLDEVAELTPLIQGKLLRILEAREYSPVGSAQVKKSKARFIAATNVDLQARVASGEFREDLFYRLNVASINLPPLRERQGDMPRLIDFLLRKINRDLRKNIRRVSGEAMACLNAFAWPGNVRQLENVLMKAAVMERGDTLTIDRLPPELRCSRMPISASGIDAPIPKNLLSLREMEKNHIVHVLEKTGWHKGQACEILDISRPKLERRIHEFNLSPPDRTSGN